MAALLQLTDGTTTVNLLSGYFKLSADGWGTVTSGDKVWETIDLVASASDSNIRTTKKQLDTLAFNAEQYHLNKQLSAGVWFQWNADGETAKRALVYQIESEILADENLSSPMLGKSVALLRVSILRHQYYEVVTGDITGDKDDISLSGGTWNIRSTISSNNMGTAAGRIKKLYIETNTAGTAIQELWIGVRPYYKGTSSFVSLWEAEDGSGGTSGGDSQASGGSRVAFDLTSEINDGYRMQMLIDNVIADTNYSHFVGKYLVLARMKVDSADTEVNVELRQYWQGSHSHVGSTYIDGPTSYKLFPLGEISFPPTGNRDSTASDHADFKYCGFSIFAHSTDATGTLYIDCFILIPSEYMVAVEGCNISTTPYTVYLYTDPDDSQWALGTSSLAQGGIMASFHNWSYPVDGGIMYVAGQPSTGHNLTADVNMEITVTPRWRSWR